MKSEVINENGIIVINVPEDTYAITFYQQFMTNDPYNILSTLATNVLRDEKNKTILKGKYYISTENNMLYNYADLENQKILYTNKKYGEETHSKILVYKDDKLYKFVVTINDKDLSTHYNKVYMGDNVYHENSIMTIEDFKKYMLELQNEINEGKKIKEIVDINIENCEEFKRD